ARLPRHDRGAHRRPHRLQDRALAGDPRGRGRGVADGAADGRAAPAGLARLAERAGGRLSMGYWGGWDSYPPYVSVAERKASAQKAIAKLEKKGKKLAPVRLEGRAIASTFWGKAWCRNLERYSDIENRIAR